MRIVALLLVAGVLAGCGATSHDSRTASSAKTLRAVWNRPGQNVTVVPGASDFGPGLIRYSFLVVRKDGAAVYRRTAAVSVARGLDAEPFQRATARLEQVGVPGGDTADVSALYVAVLRLPRPGTYWLVAEPKGATVQALGQLEVKDETASPAVGAPAPRSKTPTLGDAPIAKLTTRTPPDRDLLRWSIAESIAARRPFVAVFATPKYCASRTCGPVVDVAEAVAKDFPKVRFIHVEIYEDNGADGRIKAKFEGAVSVRELRRAVRTTLAG